jgi:hypothetical protein
MSPKELEINIRLLTSAQRRAAYLTATITTNVLTCVLRKYKGSVGNNLERCSLNVS